MARSDPAREAVTPPDVLARLGLSPEYEARLRDSLPADYRIPDPIFLAELRRLFPSRGRHSRVRTAPRPAGRSGRGRTAGRRPLRRRRAIKRQPHP